MENSPRKTNEKYYIYIYIYIVKLFSAHFILYFKNINFRSKKELYRIFFKTLHHILTDFSTIVSYNFVPQGKVIEDTANYCIRNGILKDILSGNQAAVTQLFLNINLEKDKCGNF